MTQRQRSLWLPALAATLVSEVSLYLLIRVGVWPWTIPLDWHVFHSHHPLQLYVPWLLALPVVGAAAAAWSRRQGGTPWEAALSALFPAIAAGGLVTIATIGDLIVDVGGGRHLAEHTFCGTAWALVSFVMAPGLALSVGLVAAATMVPRPDRDELRRSSAVPGSGR